MQATTLQTRMNAPVASHNSYQGEHPIQSSHNNLSLAGRGQAPDYSKPLPRDPVHPSIAHSSDSLPPLPIVVAGELCQKTGFSKDQLAAAWQLVWQIARTDLFSASLAFSPEDEFFTTMNVLLNRIVFKTFRDVMPPERDECSSAKRTDSGYWSQSSRDSFASQTIPLRSSYASRDSLASILEGHDFQRSANLPHHKQSSLETDAMSAYPDSPQTLAALSPIVWTQGTTTPLMPTPIDALPQDEAFRTARPKGATAYKDQKFSAKNSQDRKFEVQCTYCTYTFASFTPLYTHEAEHHDARFEYTCPCCSTKSDTSNGMSKHLAKAHWDHDTIAYQSPVRRITRGYKLASACGVCRQFFDLSGYVKPEALNCGLSSEKQKQEAERRKHFLYLNYHQHIKAVHQGDWSSLTAEEKRSWHARVWKRANIVYAFITHDAGLNDAWNFQTNNAEILSQPWDSLPNKIWMDLLEDLEFHALKSKENANAAVYKAWNYIDSCRHPVKDVNHVSPSPAVVAANQMLQQHDNTSARPMSGILESSVDSAIFDDLDFLHQQGALDDSTPLGYPQNGWPIHQPQPAPQRSLTRRVNASMPPIMGSGQYINGTEHVGPPQPLHNQNSQFEPWRDERTVLRQKSKRSVNSHHNPTWQQF